MSNLSRITFYYPNEGRISFDVTREEAKRIKKQYSDMLKGRCDKNDEETAKEMCVAETSDFIVDLVEVLAVNVFELPKEVTLLNDIRLREAEINIGIGEAQLQHSKIPIKKEPWEMDGDEE